MPDNKKEQHIYDGWLKRRQFLKTVVIGGGVVAAGTALPPYTGKQELRSSDPELERIKMVLNKCGSEFGNIRKGY